MISKYYKSIDESLVYDKLDNGLEVYIIKKSGFACKCAYFASKFGSFNTGDTLINDNNKIILKGGLAHFLEHRLFDYKNQDVIDLYYKLGASCNAYTSYDKTVFYFNTNHNFKECLDLLLNFVTTFDMTKEAVEREKDIIIKELLMYQDDSEDKLFKTITSNLYKNHPLTKDIGGRVDEVKSTDIELLKLVHSNFYSPDNMILVISGDIDVEDTLKQIRSFNFITKNRNVIKKELDKSLKVENKFKEVICNDVNNKKMSVGIKLKPIDTLNKDTRLKIFTCLDLICSVLFSKSGELNNDLILNKQGSNLGYDLLDFEAAFCLLIDVDVFKDHNILYNKIINTIKNSLNLITKDKLEIAKKKRIASLVSGCSTPDSICNKFLNYLIDGNNYFEIIDVVKDITMSDIVEVINDYLLKGDSSYALLRGNKND